MRYTIGARVVENDGKISEKEKKLFEKHMTLKIGTPISYKLSEDEIIQEWARQICEFTGFENQVISEQKNPKQSPCLGFNIFNVFNFRFLAYPTTNRIHAKFPQYLQSHAVL